jgi:predicted RNA-binding Zn-ribbon protein involved in translation (DUF1610 family)
MTYVDGNALAGALSIAFGADVTAAEGVCGSCGSQHAFAETHVYLRCPGMVMRCPSCSAVEIVLVDRGGTMHLNVRSLASISLDTRVRS